MKKQFKTITLFFLFLIPTFLRANDGFVTVFDQSGELNYISYQVDSKTFKTNVIEKLKTYSVGNDTFEVNTSTNEFLNLYFAGGSKIKISENSEFRIDLADLKSNVKSYPSVVDIESVNINASLIEGEAYFSISEKNTFLIQTSLSNLDLSSGKYYIQTTKNSVMVYVIEGIVGIYDNVTNKKENVTSGNAVLIRPAPKLSPKQLELFSDKMITTIKKANEETFRKHLEKIEELELACLSLVYVQVNNKIICVKIK